MLAAIIRLNSQFKLQCFVTPRVRGLNYHKQERLKTLLRSKYHQNKHFKKRYEYKQLFILLLFYNIYIYCGRNIINENLFS